MALQPPPVRRRQARSAIPRRPPAAGKGGEHSGAQHRAQPDDHGIESAEPSRQWAASRLDATTRLFQVARAPERVTVGRKFPRNFTPDEPEILDSRVKRVRKMHLGEVSGVPRSVRSVASAADDPQGGCPRSHRPLLATLGPWILTPRWWPGWSHRSSNSGPTCRSSPPSLWLG